MANLMMCLKLSYFRTVYGSLSGLFGHYFAHKTVTLVPKSQEDNASDLLENESEI